MFLSRCRLARFFEPPVSIRVSFTSIGPRSVSIFNDAIATLEGFVSPAVMRKKELLRHISVLRLLFFLQLFGNRHSESMSSSSDGYGGSESSPERLEFSSPSEWLVFDSESLSLDSLSLVSLSFDSSLCPSASRKKL